MESTFPVRKRLRDFAGVLNEELGDGAESTVLQGDDSDRYVSDRHLNWQELDFGALGRKSQYGRRKHCEKVPGCHEAEPNLGGRGDNSHPRIVASAGAIATANFDDRWSAISASPSTEEGVGHARVR